ASARSSAIVPRAAPKCAPTRGRPLAAASSPPGSSMRAERSGRAKMLPRGALSGMSAAIVLASIRTSTSASALAARVIDRATSRPFARSHRRHEVLFLRRLLDLARIAFEPACDLRTQFGKRDEGVHDELPREPPDV